MKRLAAAMAIALCAPIVSVQPRVAQAADVAPFETVLASLRDEAAAMSTLVNTLKREVRSQNLRLSVPAKLSWQRAEAAFDDVAARGALGDWKTALIATRPARALAREGAHEAFSVAASEPVRLAVKGYVDAVEPRVEAIRRLVRDLPLSKDGRDVDLERRWWLARGEFEEAKKLAAVENHKQAWMTLETAVGRLDGIVLDVVWGYTDDDAAEVIR